MNDVTKPNQATTRGARQFWHVYVPISSLAGINFRSDSRRPLSAKGVIGVKKEWIFSLSGKNNFNFTIIHIAGNRLDLR
jgi:hypothetical protein